MVTRIYFIYSNPALYIWLIKEIHIVGLYLISSIITGYITFISANYVLQSNELFQTMKQYATIDALTGLGNVRQFDLEMNRHISNKHLKNDSLCLLLIDIDHFKHVNDTYGHPAGDEVLKQVGHILREMSAFRIWFSKGWRGVCAFDTKERNGLWNSCWGTNSYSC